MYRTLPSTWQIFFLQLSPFILQIAFLIFQFLSNCTCNIFNQLLILPFAELYLRSLSTCLVLFHLFSSIIHSYLGLLYSSCYSSYQALLFTHSSAVFLFFRQLDSHIFSTFKNVVFFVCSSSTLFPFPVIPLLQKHICF